MCVLGYVYVCVKCIENKRGVDLRVDLKVFECVRLSFKFKFKFKFKFNWRSAGNPDCDATDATEDGSQERCSTGCATAPQRRAGANAAAA